MNLNRKNIRKIRGLMLFAAIVILALMKIDLLWEGLLFLLSILQPFIVGGMIAFVINIPMKFFEKKLFHEEKLEKSRAKWLLKCKRGISLVLAFLAVFLVITLVILTIIPQLAATVRELANKIPVFWSNVMGQLEILLVENPELLKQVESIKIPEID